MTSCYPLQVEIFTSDSIALAAIAPFRHQHIAAPIKTQRHPKQRSQSGFWLHIGKPRYRCAYRRHATFSNHPLTANLTAKQTINFTDNETIMELADEITIPGDRHGLSS